MHASRSFVDAIRTEELPLTDINPRLSVGSVDRTDQVWVMKPPSHHRKFHVRFKFPANPEGRGYLVKSPDWWNTCPCVFDPSSTGQKPDLNTFSCSRNTRLVFLGFLPRGIHSWKSLLLEKLAKKGPEPLCLRN